MSVPSEPTSAPMQELSALDERSWQLIRAKSALENYGKHHGWCAYRTATVAIREGGIATPCNCGYDAALTDATIVTRIACPQCGAGLCELGTVNVCIYCGHAARKVEVPHD